MDRKVKKIISNSLNESKKLIEEFSALESNLATIATFAEILIGAFKKNARIFSCGNGGSMSDAIHFAEELTGRYLKNRAPLSAMAISDAGHISCTANDFGYPFIFSRFLEAWGRKGDVVFALTTSGNSENIINAVKIAKINKMLPLVLTGKNGGEIKKHTDFCLCVPSLNPGRIQEMHIKIIHILIETVERSLFPENYQILKSDHRERTSQKEIF